MQPASFGKSNREVPLRASFILQRSADRRPESCASARASCSYYSSDRVTSSGMPAAFRRLPATRPAKVSLLHVNIGTPAHIASLAVV